jgi:hypothetical protein
MRRSKRSLAEYRTFHWISLVGALAGIAGLIAVWQTLWAFYVAAAVSALLVLAIITEGMTQRASVFFSGLREFISEFTGEHNSGVFEDIELSYAYLGVSFSTVVSDFSSWFENSRRGNTKVRLLLADPNATEVLRFRAAYELGEADEALGTEARSQKVNAGAAAFAEAIQFTLTTLARVPGAEQAIQVRFHRQKLHEWIHLVDDRVLYLGMLRKGESGRKCPVAVFERRNQRSLFDHYEQWFELLWAESKDRQAQLSEYVKSTAGAGGNA